MFSDTIRKIENKIEFKKAVIYNFFKFELPQKIGEYIEPKLEKAEGFITSRTIKKANILSVTIWLIIFVISFLLEVIPMMLAFLFVSVCLSCAVMYDDNGEVPEEFIENETEEEYISGMRLIGSIFVGTIFLIAAFFQWLF